MPINMIIDIKDNKNLSRFLIGGKGHTLSKLSKSGFEVPDGFILTTTAFDYFINQNSLKDELNRFKKLEVDERKTGAKRIRDMIKGGNVPQDILCGVKEYLKKLNLLNKHLIMRSSVEVEDAEASSFAGQFKSIININIENLALYIKEIYASAFEYRVIKYCERFSVPINKLRTAIVFQEFIEGEVSGVAFVDTLSERKVIVEAVLGLNEGLVLGRITPTRFTVDLDTKSINFNVYTKQKIKFIINRNKGTKITSVKEDISTFLNPNLLLSISQKFREIALLFGKPQDIEWTIRDKKLYLLQSRNITSMPKFQTYKHLSVKGNVLYGYAASSGVASGPVTIINSIKDNLENGSILVAEYTNMDYLPQIKLSNGVITEEGGLLSHAAIVSREFNKPCVVGVSRATKILKNRDIVTVNGDLGLIIGGKNIRSVNVKYEEDELGWETLLYFEKMRKLNINNTDVYYETLPNKTIFYSKPLLKKRIINRQLRDRNIKIKTPIVYGSNEKRFLYEMYLNNINDTVTKKIYQEVFNEVNSFDPKRLSDSCNLCLKLSKGFINKAKRINSTNYVNYLDKILNLRRAYSIYILIDEYLCKGYALYNLFNNIKGILKELDIDLAEFLYNVDAGIGFKLDGLQQNEVNKLLVGEKYYKVLKYWHQNAYYIFDKIGAIGAEYNELRDKTLEKLNKNFEKAEDEDFWYLKSLEQKKR